MHRFGYAFCGDVQEVREVSGAAGRKSSCWLLRGRRRISIEPGETIIGRDPGASLFLDDRSVSRRHARIVLAEDGATLEDLGSKNGTFLGDARVEGIMPLSDGDKIKIGAVPLTVRVFAGLESTETEKE